MRAGARVAVPNTDGRMCIFIVVEDLHYKGRRDIKKKKQYEGGEYKDVDMGMVPRGSVPSHSAAVYHSEDVFGIALSDSTAAVS